MPYYNTDYTNWYVELTHGFAFDPTGAASGISFPITTLSQLLNKWNIGVATVSGQPKVKFTPGGGLLSTVSAKSTK
jgi:hypothetical protein